MSKGFATPRQFRGTGDLRILLQKNWTALTTWLNQYVVTRNDDLEVDLSAEQAVNLPTVSSEGVKLSFYGATPITKPNITGSRSGGAALSNLLNELDNLGIIQDSTSA